MLQVQSDQVAAIRVLLVLWVLLAQQDQLVPRAPLVPGDRPVPRVRWDPWAQLVPMDRLVEREPRVQLALSDPLESPEREVLRGLVSQVQRDLRGR